ncbi:MAG TPA: hypothetical protein VGW34_03190 [Allosphingosinicella sp.]|nr:hypothetical protein [Allosphingosinicella sp.]
MLSEQVGTAAFVAPPALTGERALKDLETILYSVAAAPAHYRNFAVRYMQCREALLNGPHRSALPGFLIQCGTSEKYREFITLYDPTAEARRAFLDQALAPCQSLLGVRRSYDDFADFDF